MEYKIISGQYNLWKLSCQSRENGSSSSFVQYCDKKSTRLLRAMIVL